MTGPIGPFGVGRADGTFGDPADPAVRRDLAVAIVGLGPRGLSVLERICASARGLTDDTVVTVHVIDRHRPGAGHVWRREQDRNLLMNTVAAQISLFTDASVELQGPLEPGPALDEWAGFLSLMAPVDGYDGWVLEEARRLGPDTYPTRAFYGAYLDWVFRRVVRQAPPQVRVVVHRGHAVRLRDLARPGGPQELGLADGTGVTGLDAVILAQGHLPVAPTVAERALAAEAAAAGLRLVPPGNPADADLSGIAPGEAVAVRGLGLCYFDYQALLTAGRGGVFERRDGRLHYRPSGREPRLFVASRRGVPYQARGDNEKGAHGRHVPRVLTPPVIDRLRLRAAVGQGLDFRRDLWPLIAKEVETVYYHALLTSQRCGCVAERFRGRYLQHRWGSPQEAAVLDEFGVAQAQHWDWPRIAHPYAGEAFADPAAFTGWLLRHLRRDVVEARAGNVHGPLKAALDVLRDLRNEVRLVVEHNGLTARSHREDLDGWYTPLNAYLSVGPPARRVEEAIALIEAGVLHVVGPDALLRVEAGRYVLESPLVPGSRVHATTLIEARLPEPDLRRTTDPLLRDLAGSGQVAAHRVTDAAGVHVTGGVAVTGRPYHLIDVEGRPHPRRLAFGVPTEGVHWVTAAGIRPGVNSVTLADADAIARAVLSLPPRAPETLAGVVSGATG